VQKELLAVRRQLDLTLTFSDQARQDVGIGAQLVVAADLEALQVVGKRDTKMLRVGAGLARLGALDERLEEGCRAA
jgi:hypothetical protein